MLNPPRATLMSDGSKSRVPATHSSIKKNDKLSQKNLLKHPEIKNKTDYWIKIIKHLMNSTNFGKNAPLHPVPGAGTKDRLRGVQKKL